MSDDPSPIAARVDWEHAGLLKYDVPALDPDQFLYSRRGPWPQPSPSHPIIQAPQVLNIPAVEQMLWNNAIGSRYLQTQTLFPPVAAARASELSRYAGPTDEEFDRILLDTCYTRYLRRRPVSLPPLPDDGLIQWVYDFRAMSLVEPLDGMHTAATRVFIHQRGDESTRTAWAVEFTRKDGTTFVVLKGRPIESPSWELAKAYALQGAAYHMLFVTHPAIHFPLDTVNAVTKTCLPYTHPIFQLLLPHTSYTLTLNNAVLDGRVSVVSDNVQGTWVSPLTGNAPNLKLLFGAGYHGLEGYDGSYPRYRYLEPQMGFESAYGRWLQSWFDEAILPFCTAVADYILGPRHPNEAGHFLEGYTRLWAEYNATHIYGFPNEDEILQEGKLARALATFVFLATVSHGGDHHSFGKTVPGQAKFLRIRVPPPNASSHQPGDLAGRLYRPDDLYRTFMAQRMYFEPNAVFPNLRATAYAFTEPLLQAAVKQFHKDMDVVGARPTPFMPLKFEGNDPRHPDYRDTIPQSIQY